MPRSQKNVKAFISKKIKIDFDHDDCFNTYSIDKILEHKIVNGVRFVLVKWRFYAPTWTEEDNIEN